MASLMVKVNQGLQQLEFVRLENFNLKKMIAFDRKKYLDLKTAFMELKVTVRQLEEEVFMRSPDLHQMAAEKKDLENNLKTLTNEVEFLSKKNEDFLKELKTKNFYDVYRQ